MHRAGSFSWQINIDRWVESFDVALWFRAAERIEVPAEGTVPGALDIKPPPEPSLDARVASELAAGWLAWWRTLTEAPKPKLPFDPSSPPAVMAFLPPDFAGLASWPLLRQVVARRWSEAHHWHTARKRAGIETGAFHDQRTSQVVAEVERELGRKARPFCLDLVLLPVVDDKVRLIGRDRYLVPEAAADGARWPELLRTLVSPLA